MTTTISGATSALWAIALIVIAIAVILIVSRRPGAHLSHQDLIDETRRTAADAAREAAQKTQDAIIADFKRHEQEERQHLAEKRKETAATARQARSTKIESLRQWREPFVAFVRRLAEPYFTEWELDEALLDEWVEERADVYIKQKPYVLQIIQSVHADAQREAERYAGRLQKSPREIARQRARPVSRGLNRNEDCPYCGVHLTENAHLDHIVPVQRGGPSEAWNLVFVCIPCNRAKRDLSLMEFVDSDYARRKDLKISAIVQRLKELDKYFEVLR